MGMKTRDEDFVEHLFIASTHAYILIFTNTGRVYWLKVYEIPDVGAAGKGKHVGSLVSLQPGETVRTMLAVRNLEEEGKYVFFATRNGTVKKTDLKDFSPRPRRRHHRHQHREGRRTGSRPPDRRRADHLPGLARRPGHPLRRNRRPLHGPQRHRRARHEPRRKRLHRRHGDDGQARCSAAARSGERPRRCDSRSRRRRQERLAHPLRHRKRIRQAHRRRRIPPDQPRRQRRDQRQDHRTQRQSRRHRPGHRRMPKSC